MPPPCPTLEAVAPALRRVSDLQGALRVRVIADVAPDLGPGVEVEFVPWTPAGWREALAGCAVGIAPLPDDPWTRGKCGLRVLLLLAAARPVVASPVGVQAHQVQSGVTGWHAPDGDAWVAALLEALHQPEAAAARGLAGYRWVRAEASVAVWSRRVVDLWEAWLR